METYLWLIEPIAAGAGLLLLTFFLRPLLRALKKLFHLQDNEWSRHFVHVFYSPSLLLISILGVSYFAETFALPVPFLPMVRSLGLIAATSFFFIRLTGSLGDVLARHMSRQLDTLNWLRNLASISIVFSSLLAAMHVAGINVFPLLTMGGIGAAVLGYASKDVLANFFSGLLLHVTHPFVKGELIELKEIKGEIAEIGVYTTALRDIEGRHVCMPNSLFTHSMIINHSRTSFRKIEETIGLSHEDLAKAPVILEEISSHLKQHRSLDHKKESLAVLTSVAPHALVITLRATIPNGSESEFFRIRQELLLEAGKIIAQHGASLSILSRGLFDVEK